MSNKRVTVPAIRAMKGVTRIGMITAYDYPSAKVADAAGSAVDIAATVRTTGKTGVEMEALTAASVAALTVYDMCKAVDRSMRIEGLRVTHKAGGKSGEFSQD